MNISETRFVNLRKSMGASGYDAFFVTRPQNIFYLTGFRGLSPQDRECALLVTRYDAYLFVPQMYEVRSLSCEGVTQGLVQKIMDEERQGLLFLFREYIETNDRVACEASDLSLGEHATVEKKTGIHLWPEFSLVEKLRLVKDVSELIFLRRALDVTARALADLFQFLRTNDYTQMSEQDLADKLLSLIHRAGGEGYAFDPIIACGKGSAEPHYFTSHQKLRPDQPLLLDVGARVGGYNADVTRTVFLGKATPHFRDVYDMVLAASQKPLELVRPGAMFSFLAESANEVFRQKNVERYFLHSLGHGVGLDVHERPSVSTHETAALQEGMVFTLEPGLYFHNEFGVRIEDVVVVTNSGHEVLSSQLSSELVEI